MQKKILLISSGISVILLFALVICLFTESARENKVKEKVAIQKIEYFTNNYFRYLDKDIIKSDNNEISVSISFVPEIGSIPIKEEIYQNIAYHALQIVTFFPEVNHFKYIVLWDDHSKQEVLTLSIDEDTIKKLANIYNEECLNLNSGLETSFKRVFSSIVETDESRSWRDVIDKNSDLP
ncbi:hypothetical protein [Anaerosporobacter sp.]